MQRLDRVRQLCECGSWSAERGRARVNRVEEVLCVRLVGCDDDDETLGRPLFEEAGRLSRIQPSPLVFSLGLSLKTSTGSAPSGHAIGEAPKSIPDRIHRHTGSGEDGKDLYGRVFGTKTVPPLIRITAMTNDSEASEHRGFKNLLTGIHGHHRNPRAHATRLGSGEGRYDFFDAFTLFSYIHRRLDQAGVRP